MALENNQFDGHRDIAQFLEKFKENTFSSAVPSSPNIFPTENTSEKEPSLSPKSVQYERSFEKLEKKILELEERFEATAGQNQLILSELARTREAMEGQKDRDAFLDHLSLSIANLKASVENLSRAQQNNALAYQEPEVQRSFDREPHVFPSTRAVYSTQPEKEALLRERAEKERIISSLHQKASQLKAVNSALDREIKKAQQEKMEALKKSAEQAKEILSLRDQLTAAEERFKSFDFEGRIISIKQQYQQKVTHLETQLQEISDTCMRQVEEIESLKAENLKLQNISAEKDKLLAQVEAKERELSALRAEMNILKQDSSQQAQKQLAAFTERLQVLENQKAELSKQLDEAQRNLEAVRQEKEVLERNFKELLEKINGNDTVIEDLKQKIEVLGQHNEQLTQDNAQLRDQNENLHREKAELSYRAEALDAQTHALAHEKEELAVRAEALAQEREQLVLRAQSLDNEKQVLNKEKSEISARVEILLKEKEALLSRAEALTHEKETLVVRAEALAAQRDEISLRSSSWQEEKAALSSQTEQLTEEKQKIACRVAELEKEKSEISARVEMLAREKETLTSRAADLTREKQAVALRAEALEQERKNLADQAKLLAEEKRVLSSEKQLLQSQTNKLTEEKQALAKENQQLRNQSAALLAARLVQEKERKEQVKLQKTAPEQPNFPVVQGNREKGNIPSAPEKLSAPAVPEAPSVVITPKKDEKQEQKPVSASEAPVEVKAGAKSKVLTEADLPEIKVADPIPQPEPFDGEDFLEKTDSFIGRMKWSIFREDR